MEVVWVVIITTLIAFCLYVFYKRSYRRGYVAGANRVLHEWKNMEKKFKEDETDAH